LVIENKIAKKALFLFRMISFTEKQEYSNDYLVDKQYFMFIN